MARYVIITLFSLLVPATALAGGGMNCGFGDFDIVGRITGDYETVRLYPTYAVANPAGDGIVIPLHAHVFERERDFVRRKAIEKLAEHLELERGTPEYLTFRNRMVDFLVDNESGEEVTAKISGDGIETRSWELGETAGDGHVKRVLNVPRDPAHLNAPIFVELTNDDGNYTRKRVEVSVTPNTGFTVVSDIDDTTKVTNVSDQREMLANTFTREFREVPGMARWYEAWATRGASFHYVSASPWALHREFIEFIGDRRFPDGVYHLRTLRVHDLSNLAAFLTDSRSHKTTEIQALIDRFPDRRFILIGDSGESDPEIYGDLARDNPDNIEHIYIREVPGVNSPATRWSKAFEGISDTRWTVFEEPPQ